MLNFSLSMDEANLIMKHLGNGSYVEVSALIENLRAQAAPQLAQQEAPPT